MAGCTWMGEFSPTALDPTPSSFKKDDIEDQVANLLTELGWRTGNYAEAPVHRHELRVYRMERIVAGDPNAAFRWTGPVGSAGARQLAKKALWPDA